MDLKWSLDELYTSFESEDFINDMKKLDSSIKKINDWSEINLNTKDNAIQKIEGYINIQIELNTLFEKLMSFAELTSSVDAKNEKALMIIDKLQTKIPFLKFNCWFC